MQSCSHFIASFSIVASLLATPAFANDGGGGNEMQIPLPGKAKPKRSNCAGATAAATALARAEQRVVEVRGHLGRSREKLASVKRGVAGGNTSDPFARKTYEAEVREDTEKLDQARRARDAAKREFNRQSRGCD